MKGTATSVAVQAAVRAVEAATERVYPHVRRTPVRRSDLLSEVCRASVFLKLEGQQVTGSFKARGAFNRLLLLSPDELERGCVTASTGNHGIAFAFALKQLKGKGTVWVSHNAATNKVEAIRRLGVEVRTEGANGGEAELAARAQAETHGQIYVSPYNDLGIVGGQGTLGVEVLESIPEIDVVFVSVGGGGLVSGVAAYLKSQRPGVRIVGCQPANEPLMARSLQAGDIVNEPMCPTLSDGTTGAIEPGSITLELCRSLVDEFIVASELEIANAMSFLLLSEHVVAEGAAGVALAALNKTRGQWKGMNIGVVCCGSNLGLTQLRQVVNMVRNV